MRRPILLAFTVGFLLLDSLCAYSDETVPVAKSGGGTYPLPLHDENAMRELQGLAGNEPVKLEILSPEGNEVLSTREVVVKYRLENFEVGQPEPGQHVHVILDNKPYEADYTPDGSIVFKDVPEGTHTLFLFAARKFHLSLKNDGAFDSMTFHVLKNDGENAPLPNEPLLVYSRPKGSYSQADGSAENVMLDFYLRNVILSQEGYRVRVTVNGGDPVYLADWEPIILLHQPPIGDYVITLELVDQNDQAVPGPFNATTRTIKIVP